MAGECTLSLIPSTALKTDDRDYFGAENTRKRVDKQTDLIKKFSTQLKQEYLTFLMQFDQEFRTQQSDYQT